MTTIESCSIPALCIISFVALATYATGHDAEPAQLSITSTRFQCEKGFALVTYGYQRKTSGLDDAKLAFVVVELHPHDSSINSIVHFNKFEAEPDDNPGWRLPPAYINLDDGVVDLPHGQQLHEIIDGGYRRSNGDVTRREIRSWLDLTGVTPSIKSLTDHIARVRLGAPSGDE